MFFVVNRVFGIECYPHSFQMLDARRNNAMGHIDMIIIVIVLGVYAIFSVTHVPCPLTARDQLGIAAEEADSAVFYRRFHSPASR